MKFLFIILAFLAWPKEFEIKPHLSLLISNLENLNKLYPYEKPFKNLKGFGIEVLLPFDKKTKIGLLYEYLTEYGERGRLKANLNAGGCLVALYRNLPSAENLKLQFKLAGGYFRIWYSDVYERLYKTNGLGLDSGFSFNLIVEKNIEVFGQMCMRFLPLKEFRDQEEYILRDKEGRVVKLNLSGFILKTGFRICF